ncbi:cellulase family glycosylhydrolase [uncultured Algoriphagus sp.]|uniref:cellulase family glycosylhydrolase n=1 Tax=uncultured Algoriphagus sp. TaxID=417365 RepID=UPI0030EC612D
MDGDKVFRFVGVNSPSITGPYDGYRNTSATSKYAYDPPELTFEMESYFKDMDQMGVTVFRNWGITVSNGSDDYEAFVEAPGIYNETAFRRIDKMLQLCNQYNMRVILCLVKENKYWGGTEVFSEMHGGTDYYSDPAVREGFKDLLYAMANRKNFYTGVAYKDDKAILAWEFGNEVPNSKVAWIAEMAKYLKSIDSNHLIADPRRANGPEHMAKLVNDVLVNIPEIDIVKTRQYPNYKGTVKELWAECEGKRPMIIDEFQAMDRFTPILEEIVETGTTGGLLWSLMKNQQNGGIGGHALFHAYSWGGSRWPGFNSGEYFNEAHNLMEIRAYSYKIRELPVPPLPAPIDPPFLFKTLEQNTASLKWQVAPGARYYFVERAKSKSGPWNKVSGNIDISYDLYFYPMFTDSTATIGESYFYRVIGANVSGTTPPSNIIGPIIIKKKLVMDNLRDFSLTYSHSDNLKINSETYPRLRQTEEDYFQAERTSKSSSGEIVYKADGLKSLALFVFSDKVDSITIEYSVDGKSWKDITNNVKKTFREGYPSPISGLKDNTIGKYTYEINSMPKQSKYVKIVTGNAGAADTYPWIGRVHIGYIGALNSDKD